MTVKELYKKLKEYMRHGWSDQPIYIFNESIHEVDRVEKYSLNEFNGLYDTNKSDSILMIK